MSRSRRKPYNKDRGMSHSEYYRVARHNWKQELKVNWYKEDLEFKNPKTMINDYTFSDYNFKSEVDPYIKAFFYEYDKINDLHGIRKLEMRTTEEDVKKYMRK